MASALGFWTRETERAETTRTFRVYPDGEHVYDPYVVLYDVNGKYMAGGG